MSDNTRELVSAILAGKDYSEAFKTVMAEKSKAIIDSHREALANELFKKETESQ